MLQRARELCREHAQTPSYWDHRSYSAERPGDGLLDAGQSDKAIDLLQDTVDAHNHLVSLASPGERPSGVLLPCRCTLASTLAQAGRADEARTALDLLAEETWQLGETTDRNPQNMDRWAEAL